MSEVQAKREDHREYAFALMPALAERVDWSPERLVAYREERLRALLRHARTHSPWYRERLDGFDLETFGEADLAQIPTMTKADLMRNFDRISTDPRITLERCEAHLASDELYLDGEFIVLASGGTSGVRAVMVNDRRSMAINFVVGMRLLYRWAGRSGAFTEMPSAVSIAASSGAHGSRAFGDVFAREHQILLSVTDPIEKITAELERIQPEVIFLYPSILPRLLAEVDAGRLQIAPKALCPLAEPYLPEHEVLVAQHWGCAVLTTWGASEVGLLGGGSGFDPGMLLADDTAVIEAIGVDGEHVEPGGHAVRLFVTPLEQSTLPLVRYEVTDELTLMKEPARCGAGLRWASYVRGRLDDCFSYPGDVTVHPHLFRHVLGQEQRIFEYQVSQTPQGAAIRVVNAEPVDVAPLVASLEAGLARVGLTEPRVEIEAVAALPRHERSAKLKRFIPLPATRADH